MNATEIIDLSWPYKRIKNKSKYFEQKFGGKWKYDGVCRWECDDGKRSITKCSSCMCDSPCNHPPRFILRESRDVSF